MLPSLGYFRSIACPAVTKDSACNRPYCQFRHSNFPSSSTDNEISLDAVNQAIQDLKSKIDNTSGLTTTGNDKKNIFVNSEEVNYVPYKPYEPASNLYKDFRQAGYSKTSIDHYEIQQRTRKKSILHAAKGPQNRNFKKQFQQKKNKSSSTVKYTLNAVTKPTTDLEYDPLCNYNVAVSSEFKPMENSSDSQEEETSLIKDKETLVCDDDELPDTDLVIDDVDEKQEESVTKIESDIENLQPPGKSNLITEDKRFKMKDCSVRLDVSKHINELAEKSHPDFSVKNRTDTSKFRNPPDSNLQENLFGNDSDCEIVAVSYTKGSKKKTLSSTSGEKPKQITKSEKALPKNEKQIMLKKFESDISINKRDKKSTQHSKFNKKLNRNIKSDKHLVKNDIISPNKQNISGKISKRKHNEDGSTKPKKKKISPQKDANISDYIAEDEIKRLDKELQGENMLEECMQIYKEGLSEKGSKPPKCVDHLKVFQGSGSKAKPLESKITDSSETNIPRFKAVRKAHIAADNSAKSLYRVPKKARRFPTPAQAMLRRLEIIKHEQEEKIIDAAIAGYSLLPSATKSRLAHSSSKNVSSANLGKKACKTEKTSSYVSLLLSSRHQRKPFVDLVRSTTDSTQQGTVTKGCKRVAHEQKKEVSPGKEVIERPKILPDRFSKVPTNIRQRYLSVFIDECLRIFAKDRRKAYQMAKMEEKQCKERSNTKNIYLSLAASTLKKLRNMDAACKQTFNRQEKVALDESSYYPTPVKVAFKSNGSRLAHGSTSKVVTDRSKSNVKHYKVSKTPRRQNSGFSVLPKESSLEICGEEVYEKMCKYIMTEEQLQENGYPRPGDVPGNCVFMIEKGKLNNDPTKKICARCGKEFVLFKSGHFAKQDDECIHHWGRAYFTKVGSTYEKRYNCCQNPVGSEGCSVGETHVHQDNKLSVSGYVRTLDKTFDSGNPGIFSLDCEMVYSTVGLELVRVSVVDYDFNVVYDTFVKPRGKILDYNTRWSGVCAKDMVGVKTTIRDVQAAFLTKFSSDTILMGHSLESDLVALRIIHSTVVDTSIVFPHRLGPPYKRALRNLMSDLLGILIQNADDEGHDSSEDATACIKLMKWKLAEDAKLGH